MTLRVTVDLPERLDGPLQQFKDRLPEVMERGLNALLFEQAPGFQDEQEIMSMLASQPTPEQIMAIRPSTKFQQRASELLARSKVGQISKAEEAELERYLTLEHLVRLAKTQAYRKLNPRQ